MEILRKEYPRPQFERNDWINLNGEWSCAFDFSRSGEFKNWHESTGFDQKIRVPFCPESKLSGIGFTDFIEMMWYQREISIPAEWQDKRILLHFGGVDYKCVIYIDGKEAGGHTGGCSPFAVDLTKFVKYGSSHNLVVRVEDYTKDGIQPLGKQSPWFDSRGCSYTRTTGIWQTVWMEAVHPNGIKSCQILPDYDNGTFTFLPVFYSCARNLRFTVTLLDGSAEAASATITAGTSNAVTLKLENPKEWNPENPFLYDVIYRLTDEKGTVLDEVRSYAGLRKIHIEGNRCYLNNQPIFFRFVLDQGFYPDGIWTAPSDEALKRDIELSMQAGFNGARLHQKIFDERFHYWADKLGYLTWAEYPDWGMSFWQTMHPVTNPDYQRSFRNYLAEWQCIVERDRNHPSIVAWTPFNEARVPYDIEEHRRFVSDVVDLTKRLDPSRPVNDTSGYIHAKPDLWTIHIYAQTVEILAEQAEEVPVCMSFRKLEENLYDGQPYIVDEYGGVRYIPEGKEPYAKNSWGYNKENLSRQECEERITALTYYLVEEGRYSGYCYTQLTDIEQEENGIYCYDRSEKFDMEAIRKCFSRKPEWSLY